MFTISGDISVALSKKMSAQNFISFERNLGQMANEAELGMGVDSYVYLADHPELLDSVFASTVSS